MMKKMLKSLLQGYNNSFCLLLRCWNLVCMRLGMVAVLFVSLATLLSAQSSNLSSPFVQNYTKSLYQAGSQNWDIQESNNGMYYFANSEGLLTFDGTEWELFQLPNKTIVRTVVINKDKIYVGGQGEMGFFKPNAVGQLRYHSLIEKIPEANREFSDVWEIFFINDLVHFRTENRIYRLEDGKTKMFTSPNTIKSSLVINDTITVLLKDLGIYQIQEDKYIPVYTNLGIDKEQLASMLPWEDYLLIFTQRNGIWKYKDREISKWSSGAEEFFKKNNIRSSMLRRNGELVIGTETGGLVFLDKDRRPVYIVDKNNGLQHNIVHCIFEGKSGQIWAGLESGIDQILTGESFGKVTPDGDLGGKAYAACLHNGNFYLGTNRGLYVKPWRAYYSPSKNQDFELISGTEGQVWGLDAIGNRLWLAHANGVFLVTGKKVDKIWGEQGAWKFIPMGDKIIVGTYLGLLALEEKNNSWTVTNFSDGFNESSRIMVKNSEHELWVSHPYRGIFKISFESDISKLADVKKYDSAKGISNPINNYIFSVHKHILIGTESGILKYNIVQDNFAPFNQYNQFLGEDSWIQRLVEDQTGNIWYVKDNRVGQLEIIDKGLEKSISNHEFNFLQEDLVGGFELIYPANDQNVFIGVETGFVHLNAKNIVDPDSIVHLGIYSVNTNDSTIYSSKYYSTDKPLDADLELSSETNDITFNFGTVDLTPGRTILYRNKLVGMQNDWSEWSQKRDKEFINISHGDYEFQVQAKTNSGHQSEIKKFNFSIEAPWYASAIAKIIYALLTLGLLAGIILIPQSRFQKEKAKMESAYTQEIEKTQEELMVLKNEKLESEIKFKNKELASATMHWAQKGEILKGIKTHLDKLISDKPTSEAILKSLRSLVRSIERDAQLDDSWDQFAKHFDEVHANFLKRIKEEHPAISNNDLKLCAYLKMNLNTKEIAPLLNISVRGVEASRYRLRKKMNLEKETNLVEYIMTF